MGRASGHVFAGVDGCRAGWVVVTSDVEGGDHGISVQPDFAAVLELCADALAIAVDMPIGLADVAVPGGREADRLARELLRPVRHQSVFSSPVRPILAARSYPEAIAISHECSVANPRGISRQCFMLLDKIREIDSLIEPRDQDLIFESHPEVAFCSLNGGHPMPSPKRSWPGQLERRNALAAIDIDTMPFEASVPRSKARIDDILDAAVLCWLAGRIFRGEASRIPEVPPLDSRGLRMEIWY